MIFYLDKMQPKGTIVLECGQAMLKNGYKVKVLNTINFKKSIETTGTYSDTITLPDGGNYIGIECESFTGSIELNIE